MRNGADMCLRFCNEVDAVNPLVVSFLHSHCLLTSNFTGDISTMLWRRNGDLCCAATALGLHKLSPQSSTHTTLAMQIRRQIFARVFAVDKTIASFTGRPPCLSRRYCHVALPLDLDDEDLMLPQHQLAEVVRTNLDDQGWNTKTDGRLYKVTRMRVHCYMSIIRDEILELSLGNTKPDGAMDQIMFVSRLPDRYP